MSTARYENRKPGATVELLREILGHAIDASEKGDHEEVNLALGCAYGMLVQSTREILDDLGRYAETCQAK